MRFSPADRPAPPPGLIATELELAALARQRVRRIPSSSSGTQLAPPLEAAAPQAAVLQARFSPAESAATSAGLCAGELDAQVPAELVLEPQRPVPARTAAVRSTRTVAASIEAGAPQAS